MLPTTICIGPITYGVLEVSHIEPERDGVCTGEIVFAKSAIYVVPGLDPQFAVLNLWHECIHGILAQAGIDPAKHDEQVVEALAYGLIALVRNNPLLMAATIDVRSAPSSGR